MIPVAQHSWLIDSAVVPLVEEESFPAQSPFPGTKSTVNREPNWPPFLSTITSIM